MAQDEPELKTEVRDFTQYTTGVLSDSGIDTALSRAKRHIAVRKNVSFANFDYFQTEQREEALFWLTCLFAKVMTGELDSQKVQIGAVDIDDFQSNDDGNAVIWAQNSERALAAIDSGGDNPYGVGITSPEREDRVYGGDDTGGTDAGLEDLT